LAPVLGRMSLGVSRRPWTEAPSNPTRKATRGRGKVLEVENRMGKRPRTSGMTPSGPTQSGSVPALPILALLPTCGVCVTSNPQWLWISESLGFRVAWVWARRLGLLPGWLRDSFPTAHFTRVSVHLSPVSLVLCDSLAPGWVLEMPQDYPRLVSLRNLIKDRQNRQQGVSQGTFGFVKMRHADLGGLTERSQTVRFWTLEALTWEAPPKPEFLPSMVYSVASDTEEAGRHAKAPRVRVLDPVRVKAIGPNVYHGGGLCPEVYQMAAARFLLPLVFHQPTRWCICRLLPIERWTALDVPWSIARLSKGMPAELEGEIYEQLVPGRCLEQGLRTLLRGYGLMTEGGVLSFLEKEGKQVQGTRQVQGIWRVKGRKGFSGMGSDEAG
jgi:hypothetical protein